MNGDRFITLSDIYSKIKNKRSFFEKVNNYVPLYHGYKEKELRRESDLILRKHIYQVLTDAKSSLKKSQTELVSNNKMKLGNKTDNLLTKCDTISQQINHAVAGYSGFWDAIKVKEDELEKIYEIDSTLASLSDEIKSSIESVYENLNDENQVGKKLETVHKNIESFEKQMIVRKEFILGYGKV